MTEETIIHPPVVGFAMEITKDNRESIAIINGGVAVELEGSPTVFFVPGGVDDVNDILFKDEFLKKYDAPGLNPDYFTQVREI